jgi:hypothetical protein
MLRVLDKDGDGTIDYEEVRQRVCFFVFAVVLFFFRWPFVFHTCPILQFVGAFKLVDSGTTASESKRDHA